MLQWLFRRNRRDPSAAQLYDRGQQVASQMILRDENVNKLQGLLSNIAAAERLMAQANAQIGIARAAYWE